MKLVNHFEAGDSVKDQFGIRLPFYAVLAFVLALCGQTLLCGLLLGFVIYVQRDQWLTRQVMQALFVCLLGELGTIALTLFSSLQFLPLLGYHAISAGVFLRGILAIVVVLLAILGLVRTSQGQEAELPLAAALARKAFS